MDVIGFMGFYKGVVWLLTGFVVLHRGVHGLVWVFGKVV